MLRRRWKWFFLALVLGGLIILTFGLPFAIAYLVTHAGTRPMDQALTSTPADYGLGFEEVTFLSADGVRLSGWYLDTEEERGVSVALGHGLFRSRREVLDRAAFFRKQGFDALVFDFRNHGESGGARTTLGYNERLDFEGAVGFLRERNPENEIVLYGVSMGAAAALLAASETPEVAAVVADSPFLSFEQTVVHHVKLLFGLPRFPFASVLMFFLETLGEFEGEDFDLERAVKKMGARPVLIVGGGEDRRMPLELQRRLYEASLSPRSELRVFPDARHGAAYRIAPEEYRRMLLEFLREADLGG